MLRKQRLDKELVWIAKHGYGSIRDLAVELGVSEMTVRRDLRFLQEKGLIDRVQGGGEMNHSSHEPAFLAKRLLQQPAKSAIAKKALSFIEPEMTLGFSAGTTTWEIAKRVHGFSKLTFVTNSTNIALELHQNDGQNIILTGGNFRTASDALVGPFAEQIAGQLHTDILFLGVHGLDLGYGFSTPNVQEAAIDRILLHNSSKVIVVMDHTKWNVVALAKIAEITEVDAIITDKHPDGLLLADQAERLGLEVHLVVPDREEEDGAL